MRSNTRGLRNLLNACAQMPEVQEILVSKNRLCQSPRSLPQAIRNAGSGYEIVGLTEACDGLASRAGKITSILTAIVTMSMSNNKHRSLCNQTLASGHLNTETVKRNDYT